MKILTENEWTFWNLSNSNLIGEPSLRFFFVKSIQIKE
jgi:hypothetical protein